MITRRSLFEFLAIVPTVPVLAKVVTAEVTVVDTPKRVVSIVQGQSFTPRVIHFQQIKIERAFMLLGLILPGESIGFDDYQLALGILNKATKISDRELALRLADYYGVSEEYKRRLG